MVFYTLSLKRFAINFLNLFKNLPSCNFTAIVFFKCSLPDEKPPQNVRIKIKHSFFFKEIIVYRRIAQDQNLPCTNVAWKNSLIRTRKMVHYLIAGEGREWIKGTTKRNWKIAKWSSEWGKWKINAGMEGKRYIFHVHDAWLGLWKFIFN